MRKIGSLESREHLATFRFYLYAHGIETHDNASGSDIWVLSEDQVPRAVALLAEFRINPRDARYELYARQGERKQKLEHEAARARAKKLFHMQRKFTGQSWYARSPLSAGLIATSVLFFIAHFFDREAVLFRLLSFSQDHLSNALGLKSFAEIKDGQFWRFVTPMFIHTDFLHILFNMMWLYTLGIHIEQNIGARKMAFMVFTTAAVSNTAFYLVAGPAFGGMSGVVYGMIGYMAAANYFGSGRYPIDFNMIKFFAIFYVICWVLTVLGMRVANTIHGVGALTGAAFAFFASGRRLPTRLDRDFIYKAGIVSALIAGAMITDNLTY